MRERDAHSPFVRFLNEEKVEYLLVGGYAVGFHGYPRATGDMDVWIAIGNRNAGRVVKALERFGFTRGLVDGLSISMKSKKRWLRRRGMKTARKGS